jgi:hypothetical protein
MTADDILDRTGIQEVMAQYAWGNDVRDIPTIAACFADDGTFGLQIAGHEPVGPIVGRPAVAEFMESALRPQTDQRRHVISNISLTRVDPDRFQARSYLSLMVTDGGVTRVATTGWYEDTFVRGPEGWLISSRWLWLDGQF